MDALSRSVATERGWLEFIQSNFSRRLLLELALASGPDWSDSLSAATLGVVKTKTDDEHGWLNAGRTLALVALQAQAWGLPWGHFHPLPRRETREALRRRVGRKGFGQVILRFGTLVPGESVGLTPSASATAAAAPAHA